MWERNGYTDDLLYFSAEFDSYGDFNTSILKNIVKQSEWKGISFR